MLFSSGRFFLSQHFRIVILPSELFFFFFQSIIGINSKPLIEINRHKSFFIAPFNTGLGLQAKYLSVKL